ncbi:uracil-DNA glycosylase [Flavobacteriaceae bacterium]|nr:uracil-DNA glycosylase [Flavobacteriaceae bacterium]
MKNSLPNDWKEVLKEELDKEYFTNLENFVDEIYEEETCFPPKKEIFNALKWCSFKDTKVVIIGQDPYHGPGQANGLCFSVSDFIPHPPSLKNILKELVDDLNVAYPIHGNLEKWAKQGVLLLNDTLTVTKSNAGSHQKQGWSLFTDAIIKQVAFNKENIVFILWGGFAQKKGKLIDNDKHLVLKTGHPSPLSANRKLWFGNKHFSKTNNYLVENKLQPINWDLDT